MTTPLLPRLGFVFALGAVAALGLRGGGCFTPRLRVGTFNIEHFGNAKTEMKRLAELIASTDVDVLSVQEIEKPARARDLLARLPRRFEMALSKCGGSGEMRVGYFYDPDRVRLVSTTEHQDLAPEPSDSCERERPGLSAKFERPNGDQFQLLVFHLVMGHKSNQQERRREQWKKAHVIAAKLGQETPVAILGDANSTGFLDDAGGERTFIVDEAKKANLEVVSSPLGCSEYYRLEKDVPLTPSLLDHIVATPGLARGGAKLWGYCAELACKVPAEDPEDFKTVSDHCPITIDL